MLRTYAEEILDGEDNSVMAGIVVARGLLTLLSEREQLQQRVKSLEDQYDFRAALHNKDKREQVEAHLALDEFGAPRTEPHFRRPYRLSGRIRCLRSTLVIDANRRAGKLEDRALDAEAQAAHLEEALREALT